MVLRRYLIHLSYFGTRYSGLQKQNTRGDPLTVDPHTICGLLELALKGLYPVNHPNIVPSSRTDKGVHALSNTVHVDLEESSDYRFNSGSITSHVNRFFDYNGHDIRIVKTQQVADDFHCRFKVCERQYLYRVAIPRPGIPVLPKLTRAIPLTEWDRCLFLRDSCFDSEAVKSACSIFVGEKDFNALGSNSKNRWDIDGEPKSTKRIITSFELVSASPFIPSTQLSKEYDFWHFIISGKSFLYHQVRRMVSALLRYGAGRVTLADLQRLVDEPVERSWHPIGQMVAAHGLYLVDVSYRAEDLAFTEDFSSDNLLEEKAQILQKLEKFDGKILEKINLKKRLLDIEYVLAKR